MTMRDDFKQWLIDMLSLIGAVMHMIGQDVGATAIRMFDVALPLEMTFADAQHIDIRPPGCPTDVDWIAELDQIYQQSSSSSSSSSSMNNRKTAVKYEGMILWILSTVFGLVSIQPRGEGFGTLDDRIMFIDRSFQELDCSSIVETSTSN